MRSAADRSSPVGRSSKHGSASPRPVPRLLHERRLPGAIAVPKPVESLDTPGPAASLWKRSVVRSTSPPAPRSRTTRSININESKNVPLRRLVATKAGKSVFPILYRSGGPSGMKLRTLISLLFPYNFNSK